MAQYKITLDSQTLHQLFLTKSKDSKSVSITGISIEPGFTGRGHRAAAGGTLRADW